MKTTPLFSAAFAFLAFASLQAAQPVPELSLLVETGQAAPSPTGPATFAAVSKPVINTSGNIVFHAQVAGSGITSANDDALYLRDSAGKISRIVGEGDVVADVNLPVASIGTHNLLDNGTVLLLASFGGAATAGDDGALLIATPGQPVKLLAREGQIVGESGLPIGATAFPTDTAIYATQDANGDGTPDLIAVNAKVTEYGVEIPAILYFIDGALKLGPKPEGEPQGDISTYHTAIGVDLNGNITFVSGDPYALTSRGISQFSPASSTSGIVHAEKQAASSASEFGFSEVRSGSLSNDGRIAVDASIIKQSSGGGVTYSRGGLLTIPSDGLRKPSVVAGRDRLAMGVPGPVAYSEFYDVTSLNKNRGKYVAAFHATLVNRKKPDAPLSRALYVSDAFPRLIARKREAAPGFAAGATIKSLGALTTDNASRLYWPATVTMGTGETQAVFTTSLANKKLRTDLLLKTSALLRTSALPKTSALPPLEPPANSRRIIGIVPFPAGSGQGGAAAVASPAGLVVECTFEGGTSGLVLCRMR